MGRVSKSFNPDIDSLTRDKDLVTVFPTSYTPASALDESSWQPFEISAAELAKLLSDAPREIRNRFNVGNTGSSIESLRFEFSSAKLLRPWFRPEVSKRNSGNLVTEDYCLMEVILHKDCVHHIPSLLSSPVKL